MTPEFELFYDNHLSLVEGGEVDIDFDKGGHTWYGISSKFLENIGRKGPVSKEDAKKIAYDYFWEPNGCQEMDPVAAWCYCDAVFNHSPRAAGKMLQHGLQVTVDGSVGPQTKEAAKVINRTLFIERYRVYRTRYYKDLMEKDPTQIMFLVGWMDRVHRLSQAMVVSGLYQEELKAQKWYSPANLTPNSVGAKSNLIAGGSLIGVLAMFFPDIDLSSIGALLKDPDALRATIIAFVVRMAARWQSKTK